jgi:transposase InsO family protein
VGSATDPWRAPQARHRNRTDQRGQVHGQEKRPAISRLADVPSQSCRRHRRDGSVRRADNLISFALRLVDCGAWPTADFVVWRHGASDLRMDRKSDHGSLRLGTSSPISDPRSGWGLWRVFIRRLRSMGIRDRPTSPRSPWQNGYAERLIGSIRRECVDHIIVLGERHLRHVLLSYMQYYNEVRTHLSLNKDAPVSRAVDRAGHILCRPILGGLHHQYVRI